MDWEPRIGMKVVCLKRGRWDDEDFALPGVRFPRYGELLTIRSVILAPSGQLYLLFEEIRNPTLNGDEDSFWSARFRPLRERKTDISCFTAMLDHTPKELIPASYEMPGRPFQ